MKKKRKVTFRFKLILLACFLVCIGVSAYTQQMNISAQAARNGELVKQYEQAQDELSRLEHQSEYMGTDKYIENAAREKLGMVYKDELILEPEK